MFVDVSFVLYYQERVKVSWSLRRVETTQISFVLEYITIWVAMPSLKHS